MHTINGERRESKTAIRASLLDALREHRRLTGTSKTRNHRRRGACTVLVNAWRIDCLTRAVMRHEDDILTIERDDRWGYGRQCDLRRLLHAHAGLPDHAEYIIGGLAAGMNG